MDDDRFLITPPPGLLPPPREPAPQPAPVTTGSETRRTGITGVPVVPAPTPAPGASPVVVPAAPSVHSAPAVAPEREPGAWFIRLADGREHQLGPGGLVLGRNPTPPPALPDAVAVRVDDPGKSVSKTHAALAFDGDRVRVLDLRSTNGVAVTPARGDAAVVPDGGLLAEAGAIVALGEVTLRLDRR